MPLSVSRWTALTPIWNGIAALEVPATATLNVPGVEPSNSVVDVATPAGVLVLTDSIENMSKQIQHARELSSSTTIEVSGSVTLENVRAYAEAGADLIRVHALTQSVRAMPISFQIQPG